MTTIQKPHAACGGQTVSDEYRRWVFETMPQMGALLDKLDSGESPNFYDVMGAISNVVAFYMEGDSFKGVESMRFPEMSGKYCRFCY